jgi:hypothetical protein
LALFGPDRRVGECLLLREEQKSGLGGPTSESDPKRTLLSSSGAKLKIFETPLLTSKKWVLLSDGGAT